MLDRKKCHTRHGVLVLDVSKAKVPGLVRVDFAGISFSHFHVRSSEQGSTLGYADAEGRFTALATFVDRVDADKMLIRVQKTLIGWRPGPVYRGFQVLTVLLAVGFIVIAAAGLFSGKTPMPQNPAFTPPVSMAPQPGSPVDADSKLALPGN